MIETEVQSIRVNLVTQNRVVILKEVQGERHLPIWIGDFEAQAIAMELQGIVSPRPLPYDLIKALLGDLGATVDRILVTDLNQDVFYARIIISIDGKSVEIDSRPSDAIAIAVRTHTPILVEESVMDRAGVSLEGDEIDQDAEQAISSSAGPEGQQVDDERLSVFRDFINTLDLDDFDRKRGS